MEDQLKGNDDTLFCRLRSVEVAMAVFEKRQSKAATNAEHFFRPLRAMGIKRLQERCLLVSASQSDGRPDLTGPTTAITVEKEDYSQREQEHLHSDASEAT